MRGSFGAIILQGAAVALALLLAGALIALSQRHASTWDWTVGARHSLSEASRALLDGLPGPVRIEAFMADDPQLRRPVAALIARFQRHKPDITLELVDPKAEPNRVRRAGVAPGGELVVHYEGRQARVQVVDEARLSTALVALAQRERPWIVFTEGRGERSPFGQANHDLARFAAALGERGMQVQALDPDAVATIPDNTAVLVIASPERGFTADGQAAVTTYLERGGRLLWLRDPREGPYQDPLDPVLGVRWHPGVVLSARNRQLGIDNPAFVVGATGPDAPLGNAGQATLLPVAGALESTGGPWQARSLLASDAESWNETGLGSGARVRFGDGHGERRGPLDLALSLQHTGSGARAIVVGDGDFLSNAYLDNGANRDLGVAMVHWLAGQDLLAGIARPKPPDLVLELDGLRLALLGWGFPFALPALLWLTGLLVRRHRRLR